MELDATQVTPEGTIETDVCIIGAGPAGLVVAAELSALGRDVVLLESGSQTPDARTQTLNDGDVLGAYTGLRATRHRGVGGTACLWNTPTPDGPGAKYAPLDPWDLEPRWPEAPDGWPIRYDELLPLYARAQGICGLGPLAYDAESWVETGAVPLQLEGAGLVSRVYQLGGRDALLTPLVAAVRRSTNARLYTRATVVQLAAERSWATVTVAQPGASRWRVRARRAVLAAGAVENARLLLVAAAGGGGVADRSGWLGCGFMEHPRDRTLTLKPRTGNGYRSLGFYDLHAAADGTTIAGRLGLEAEAARGNVLLNTSATLLPIVQASRARLRTALGRVGTVRSLQRWLPAGGYGWSLHPDPARVFDGFSILLNIEQPPHRENAIRLGNRRDEYGVPLPELRWRWHPEDQARLEQLRAMVAAALEGAGMGSMAVARNTHPDPNAHHHAGTTRMHADRKFGVVDADGRVHGTEVLFVVGASVFPSAGFANPMLTIVAMALRLAERLRDDS